MQGQNKGATRVEQIVHHATEFIGALDVRRKAVSRADKDAAATLQREREAALEKAVKSKPER
jgi:hypothetical protein